MAIIRSKALRETGVSELKNRLRELELELMKFSSQRAAKSVSNPGRIKLLRRSIAKLLTAISLKKAEEVKAASMAETKTKANLEKQKPKKAEASSSKKTKD